MQKTAILYKKSQICDKQKGGCEVVNSNKLRAKMIEQGYSVGTISESLGINQATLYRKMDSGNFTIKEAKDLAKILHLDKDEVNAIFFADEVA